MRLERLFDVQGAVAVVTGAASGLGLAFAEAMAENGAAVLLTDVDAAALERETIRLRAMGADVEPALLDIADAAALKAAFDGFVKRRGRLDAVFANAGVSAGPGFQIAESGWLENVDGAAFDRVLAINLRATVHTMGLAAEHMKPRRKGSIVATASIAGIRAEPLCGYAYAASKAAVCNVVRQAAIELAPHNVRVNAIAPGPFLTNIAGGRLHRDPEAARLFADTVPLGRLAHPDEIKGLALLLASGAGSFITGAVIPIDGGTTAA
jgi:NAD(P)-dependent dehydrogenase (short-subunit alcohol dehydrogenase family)